LGADTLQEEAQVTLENKSSAARAEVRSLTLSARTVVSSPPISETGMWIVVAAISMSFAAYTSALIVRQGASSDWLHFQLPRVLYFNTLILLASSVTVDLARRRFVAIPDTLRSSSDSARALLSNGVYWLYVTAALGAFFVLGQILAWRNLAAQGLFLATNPSSSFFYVFTALHGVHLLGGLAGLSYVLRKLAGKNGSVRTSGFGAFSIYWHFMDILWIYLLLLLAVRT
jgi:cytochrome c oxidase subunit 3